MNQSKDNEPVAHISEDGRYHALEEHLNRTSELAAQFAKEFGSSEWAALAGLWHDLGKYSRQFQEYIRSSSCADGHIETKKGRVDHSTFGARMACEKFGIPGRILAYIIAGHHAGLPDWQTDASGMAGLAQRLNKIANSQASMFFPLPEDRLIHAIPTEKPRPGADPSMWIRMLFSCIVDADFLDTERFMDPEKSKSRGNYPDLAELLPMFNEYMHKKLTESGKTDVNQIRSEILQRCVSKAELPPQIFSLTVPTGGGKTLSSMAFALNHAKKNSKRRVIYVIPYTSIIEQTASQFREIFGEVVVEHHSNIDISETSETLKSRVACENWDAPIIVTTTVQFFESLYASRTSRCRKLHNIINGVVILDEAQLLPPDLLNPILKALKELQNNYGVTLLLTTATQPALGQKKTSDFAFECLPDIVEIIEDPDLLSLRMKRVTVVVPPDLSKATPWEDVAEELSGYPTVLCVVNRRDDCRKLHKLMPEGTVHLSALMCGAHRSETITHIRQSIKGNIPVRVISTQLVEAGVDLDFPVVYRALAGLDSIAQAAGRCNREGLLSSGLMKVFVPASKHPPGYLRQAAEIGRQLLSEGREDPLELKGFTSYFKRLYWIRGDKLDAHGVLADLKPDSELRFSFRTAAEKFHIIDESLFVPVIVRYGEGNKLINMLLHTGPERWLMRKLQRFVVTIPRYLLSGLIEDMIIEEPFPGIYAQSNTGYYKQDTGFCYDTGLIGPEDSII